MTIITAGSLNSSKAAPKINSLKHFVISFGSLQKQFYKYYLLIVDLFVCVVKLKHVKKAQEAALAAEKRDAEQKKEKLEKQQQSVQQKIQQQKQLMMQHSKKEQDRKHHEDSPQKVTS